MNSLAVAAEVAAEAWATTEQEAVSWAVSSLGLGQGRRRAVNRAEHLPEEVEEGPVEYKLKLVKPPAERVRHLTTQMHWRQMNGDGTMFYRLGYHDDGYPRGVTPSQMAATLRVVCGMAAKTGASFAVEEDSVFAGWGPSATEQDKSDKAKSAIEASWKAGTWGGVVGPAGPGRAGADQGVRWAQPLRSEEGAGAGAGAGPVSPGSTKSSAHEEGDPSLGVEDVGAEHVCLTLRVTREGGHGRASWEELRVAVIGDEASGKSTLVSVMTQGGLDDGRGLKRIEVFRHFHEVEAGRTSAISEQILGFDCDGGVVDGAGREVNLQRAAAGGASTLMPPQQGPTSQGMVAGAGHAGTTVLGAQAAAGGVATETPPPPVPAAPVAATSDPFAAGSGPPRPASVSAGHRKSRSSSMVRQEHVTAPSWRELVAICSGGRVVVFCDTGGHERYARTAMLSLLGRAPDLALLVVDATKGLTRRAKERLGVVLALRLPVAVVVAKSDVVSASRARGSVRSVMKLLRSHGVGRRAIFVPSGAAMAATLARPREGALTAPESAASGVGIGNEACTTSSGSAVSLPDTSQIVAPLAAAVPSGGSDPGLLQSAVSGDRMGPGRSVSTGEGSEDGEPSTPARQSCLAMAAAATVPGSSAAQLEEQAGADAAEHCVLAAASGAGWPVPVFVASSVTGKGLRSIRTFLQRVPKQRSWAEAARKEALVLLHAAWDVEGVGRGLVVSGVVAQGRVAVGDGMLLGPDGLGRFTRARVSSVHSLRVPVGVVEAGRSASFALESVVATAPPSGVAGTRGAAASGSGVAASLWAAAEGAGVGAGGADDGDMAGMGMGLLGADSDSDSDSEGGMVEVQDDSNEEQEIGSEPRPDTEMATGVADTVDDSSMPSRGVSAGHSPAAQPLRREAYRKGMVLAASGLGARACRRFEVEMVVLRHPTALRKGASVQILVRTVRQTAVVEAVEPLLDEEEAPAEGGGVGGPVESAAGASRLSASAAGAAPSSPPTAAAAAAATASAGSTGVDASGPADEVSLGVAMSAPLRSVSAPLPSAAAASRAARIRSIVQRNRLRMGARTGDRCVVRLRWQHRPEYVSEGAAVLVRDGQIRAVGRVLSVGGHSVLVGGAGGRSAAVLPAALPRGALPSAGASAEALLRVPAAVDGGLAGSTRKSRRRQSLDRSDHLLE